MTCICGAYLLVSSESAFFDASRQQRGGEAARLREDEGNGEGGEQVREIGRRRLGYQGRASRAEESDGRSRWQGGRARMKVKEEGQGRRATQKGQEEGQGRRAREKSEEEMQG